MIDDHHHEGMVNNAQGDVQWMPGELNPADLLHSDRHVNY